MTQETIDTYCENVIAFLTNSLKKGWTIDIASVMQQFDITREQFDNCLKNAQSFIKT
jgi:hypothetical protein